MLRVAHNRWARRPRSAAAATSSGVHWGSSAMVAPLNGAALITDGALSDDATSDVSRVRSAGVRLAGSPPPASSTGVVSADPCSVLRCSSVIAISSLRPGTSAPVDRTDIFAPRSAAAPTGTSVRSTTMLR